MFISKLGCPELNECERESAPESESAPANLNLNSVSFIHFVINTRI